MTMGGIRTRAHDDDTSELSSLHGDFLEEAGETLARMEALLLATGVAAPADDSLNAIFRCAHSIKGGAASFGLRDVTELTHDMETLLDGLRRGGLALAPETLDTLLESVDMLGRLLARHRSGAAYDIDCSALRARVRGLAACTAEQAAMSADPGDAVTRLLDVAVGPLARPSDADGISELFDEIVGLGRCEPADAGIADADGVRRFRVETTVADAELRDLFAFHVPRDRVCIARADAAGSSSSPPAASVRTPSSSGPGPTAPSMPASEPVSCTPASVRVRVETLDRVVALARDVLGAQSALARAGRTLDPAAQRALDAGLAALERDARRLHDAVTQLRSVTAATAFARFPRLLRDLGRRLGKPLALQTRGEQTVIDAALAERLVDPLTHLVRNAADHGIEPPALRRAQGKPASGTVTLTAARRRDELVVTVHDDGRGLDRATLLRTAATRGLAPDGGLDDRAVWRLILEPGFSTAAEVTEVSGRGVGMDVVRRSVEALGGAVEIESWDGAGMRVTLRLPATVAGEQDDRGGAAAPNRDGAVQAPEYLIVELAGQDYGIDALTVEEIRGWSAPNPIAGAPPFVRGLIGVRGADVPVVDLRLALGLPPAARDASTSVVVVRLGARLVGILVDAVSDVALLPPNRVRAAPPVDSPRDAGFVTGLADRDARTLILVDIVRLLGTPDLALDRLPARTR